MWRQSKIEEDTPFGRVARPFFYGNDDEFRNNRFKLIPKVWSALHCIAISDTTSTTLYPSCLVFFCSCLSCAFVASFLVLSCPVFFFLALSCLLPSSLLFSSLVFIPPSSLHFSTDNIITYHLTIHSNSYLFHR
jgi:hypothetical protein